MCGDGTSGELVSQPLETHNCGPWGAESGMGRGNGGRGTGGERDRDR